MEEEKKQERSYELRSEKVRSIVGQIPPSEWCCSAFLL